MSTSYFLSRHVHLCVAGKQVVLLDLERDKYLALAHTHPVGRWVRGWPAALAGAGVDVLRNASGGASVEAPRDTTPGTGFTFVESDEPGANSQAAAPVTEDRLLAKMIEQRLLVTDPTVGKEAVPLMTDRAKVALVEPQLFLRPHATGGQFWNLFRAYVMAKVALKRRPIKEVVQAASRRKKAASAAATVDIETVRTLVAAFLYLRPLFYTAHNACLLDSVALLRFLAGYGVFPDWVFGVKTEPFHAHCWVQQGGYVFNDSPDCVGEFAPILVV